jgi:hypothetical protein
MTIQVTLNLPESVLEQAQRLASTTQQEVTVVLTEALAKLLPLLEMVPESLSESSLSSLSNDEILALADLKMDAAQNQRLGDLQAKGKSSGLTEVERYELFALLQLYQLGQLRKSEGLAEAVRRGLRSPLPA